MSKSLGRPGIVHRLVASTSTRKLAQRMLNASRQIGDGMPRGFYTPTAIDILLLLHVAEDDAHYLTARDLDLPGAASERVVKRWIDALIAEQLIEQRSDLLALSSKGDDLIVSILEKVYAGQRSLDHSL